MPNLIIYWTIWFPLLSIGIIFYILFLYVLIKKRKDSVLGTSFFKIQIVLGVIEIATSINMHFYVILPKFGVFMDTFYLPYIQGIWAQIFSYLTQTLGPIQFLIVNLIFLNRIIVLLVPTKYSLNRLNKISKWILIACIIVPLIVCTPIFWTTSGFVDYRINATDPSALNWVASGRIFDQELPTLYGTFTLSCKVSNVFMSILMLIAVIIAMCKQKSGNSSTKSKIQIRLSISILLLSILYSINCLLLLGTFYFWSTYSLILLEYFFPIEDLSRMLTPILLIIFSKPLRKAFKEIYRKKTTIVNIIASNK